VALLLFGTIVGGVWLAGVAFVIKENGVCTFLPCDPASPPIGATLGASRSIELVVLTCPNERIESLRVVVVHGNVVDDGDDEVLWGVASGSSEQRRFMVGAVPESFAEDARLVRQLPEHLTLAALAIVDQSERVSSFRVDELVGGWISNNGQRFTASGFERYSRRWCAPSADQGSGAWIVARLVTVTTFPLFLLAPVAWVWRGPPRTERLRMPRWPSTNRTRRSGDAAGSDQAGGIF
jgi:hypothetical protein